MICARCRQSPGWVITIQGDPGEPDTVRPCDQCRRQAFEAWRSGAFEPRRQGMAHDDVPHLSPGENVARLLAMRDELGI